MTQSGFGNIDGEYWLGLEGIYNLGRQTDYKLLVELEDWMGKKVYAQYSSFHLEPESEGYRLRLGIYQGNAGDSLSSHNGKQFTTLDRDKDAYSGTVDETAGSAVLPTVAVYSLLFKCFIVSLFKSICWHSVNHMITHTVHPFAQLVPNSSCILFPVELLSLQEDGSSTWKQCI